ncbi:hypothetical protein J4204_02160 [Candidatus Woesearchaeota archaeon]|nr:hypothetical protein [Candidatus Woesearchaeota archaeon]
MADEQPKSEFTIKKFFWDMPTNRIKEFLRVGRRRSYEVWGGKPGETEEPFITREPEMRQLKAVKNALLGAEHYGLAEIETKWLAFDKTLGVEEGKSPQDRLFGAVQKNEFIPGIYSSLGPYVNIYNFLYELKCYYSGANYKKEDSFITIDEIKQDINDENKPELIKNVNKLSPEQIISLHKPVYQYKKVSIEGMDIIWNPRDISSTEKIYSFGYLNTEPLLTEFSEFIRLWDDGTPGIPQAEIKTRIMPHLNALTKALQSINEKEKAHYGYLSELFKIVRKIPATRDELLKLAPPRERIRFAHTYKIIQPFIFIDKHTKEKIDVLRELPDDPTKIGEFIDRLKILRFEDGAHPNWYVISDEVAATLDENGWPLEVNDDGTVLLDKWLRETGQNDWQIGRIRAKKGDHILNKITEIQSKGVREIDPRFVDFMDLLEMATFASSEYDAVRDDLRDGRYHWWSKTAHDYVIAIEGYGMYSPYEIKKIKFPFKQITGECHPYDLSPANIYSYINAKPEYFESDSFEPSDEKEVKRDFRIQLLDGTIYPPDDVLRESPEKGLRRSTNLSPSFDRRAINFATNWIHWGRMYYYEWTDGINRWSENPYPHITTRGASKYILHRLLNDTYHYAEAVKWADDEVGYDIGIRRPIVGGEFLKNPLKSILSQQPSRM